MKIDFKHKVIFT